MMPDSKLLQIDVCACIDLTLPQASSDPKSWRKCVLCNLHLQQDSHMQLQRSWVCKLLHHGLLIACCQICLSDPVPADTGSLQSLE